MTTSAFTIESLRCLQRVLDQVLSNLGAIVKLVRSHSLSSHGANLSLELRSIDITLFFCNQSKMSAFEKLPQEVRDMIYGYCLIHDGDIIPYPSIDERDEIEASGGKPAKRCLERKGVKYGEKQIVRSCGGITYAPDWPSVALLGVSKRIQEEAANILFGKNVWRLSYIEQWVSEEDRPLWFRYERYFRHITTHLSMNDAGNMVEVVKEMRAMAKNQNWSADELRNKIHLECIEILEMDFEEKYWLLIKMNLKSVVFNVENLFCPHGCCREDVLYDFCWQMGHAERPLGPWYRLEAVEEFVDLVPDIETKRNTDVKVVGLKNDSEKEIFMRHWGLEV